MGVLRDLSPPRTRITPNSQHPLEPKVPSSLGGNFPVPSLKRLPRDMNSTTIEPEAHSWAESHPPVELSSSYNRGIKKKELEQLPSFIYKSTASNVSESNKCCVCFDSFRTGEHAMALICSHKFHGKCIAPWLKVSSNEPNILN